MKREQQILANRIDYLCKEKGYSYYTLAYKASVPMSTFMHIIRGESRNPGFFTIAKICDGLEISLRDFFSDKDFEELLKEVDGK